MAIRWNPVLKGYLSRVATTVVLIATLAMSGCCAFCDGTICAPGTKIDPDGGGVIVERDDGQAEVKGGRCVPDT